MRCSPCWNLVEDSDPDNGLPDSMHVFKSGERIGHEWPKHNGSHLVVLLRDMGKMLGLPEVAGEGMLEQWDRSSNQQFDRLPPAGILPPT